MFRPLWAPQAIYIRPNKIGCSAMEVHLERVNNATLNRVPISYSWPPTNNVIRRKLKYHEYELAEKKILWKYHVYVFFNITPSDAFVFTDLTFWGDSSAFPFYELPVVLCTNFPPFHNNKHPWKNSAETSFNFWKTQLTYLLICKRSHFEILRHRRSFFYIPFPNHFSLFRPCPNNFSPFRPSPSWNRTTRGFEMKTRHL